MRNFLRVWKDVDVEKAKQQLIVVGDLSGQCYACKGIGIDSTATICPQCGCEFRYMAFRRRVDSGYLDKITGNNPKLILIDFDDFKKAVEKKAARKLLDI